MDALFSTLSLLPIAILLLVSLTKGVKMGIYTGLIVTCVLFFIWNSSWNAFPASFLAAFIDTISILMIVFGALLLHQSMEQAGFVDQIKTSLKEAHGDTGFQFYFLALFLTAFFESVAGFGTPGAIVPLLLMSLGFSPVLSIAVVLLIDGLFAISGAMGTPVTAGFQGPLEIASQEIKYIYLYGASFTLIAGSVIILFVRNFFKQEKGNNSRYSWKLYLSLGIPYLFLSFFLKELTGVIAAIIMGAFSYFFLFTNRKLDWKPWVPYGVLVIILLLPKLIPPLVGWLAWELSINQILGTSINASLQPFKSPLIPFILASLVATLQSKNQEVNFRPVFSKTIAVFLILFPSLAITRLMLSSGTDMPSMVESMSLLFAETGDIYPILSPFIGVIGTFITGSTTVSNIIFGPVQFNAAENLSLPQLVVLAMQLTGASLGNAICLFNIIAASAVAGVDKYAEILHKNILPVLCAAVLTALLGLLLITFS